MRLRRAFTLIELLVTITIISVLAGIVYVSFGDARNDARNKAMTVELKEVELALETYRSQRGTYPLPAASCLITSGDQLYATDSDCTAPFIDNLVPEFIAILPLASEAANDNCDIEYRTDAVGSWYKLTAINCLGGVDATSGVAPGDPLSRCSSVCATGSSGSPCFPGDPAYYESFAVYSLGGQCQ